MSCGETAPESALKGEKMDRFFTMLSMVQADLAIIETAKKDGIKKIIERSNESITKEKNTLQAQSFKLRIASLMSTVFEAIPAEIEDLELIAEEIADIYCRIKIIIDKKKKEKEGENDELQ